MMSILDALRAPLDAIFVEASADLEARFTARTAELDRREAELAMERERLTLDSVVQAAWRECQQTERRRCLALIERELQAARPMSAHRSSLLRLSRMVGE